MAREIDPENLTADDKLYLQDRPWLVQEMAMQGYEVPEDLANPQGDRFEDASPEVEDAYTMQRPTPQNPFKTPSAEEAQRLQADEDDEEPDDDYDSKKVAELEALIDERNAEYEEDSQISKGDGRKATLIAALREDDASEDDDEDSTE